MPGLAGSSTSDGWSRTRQALGGAISYLLKHWVKLTLFLWRGPGRPPGQ